MRWKVNDKRKPEEWIRIVLEEVHIRGYFYYPDFCTNVEDVDAVLMAAGGSIRES